MKFSVKVLTFFLPVMIMIWLIAPTKTHAQIITENTKKKINVGFGVITDIWTDMPADMKTKAINQGVMVNALYHIPFGKSNLSFGIGLGISVHNLYWNYRFEGSDDSLQFVPVEENLNYKRSKLTTPYLEIPLEFRLKTKKHIAAAIGFKAGYMIHGHAKWVGDDYIFNTDNTLKASFKDIKNIERFAFGPTARFGYKWFHAFAHYQLSGLFVKGKGPTMKPISVGLLLLPF